MGSLSKYYDPEVLTFAAYTEAKKALNASHAAALVGERKNILTQICPGYTDTDLIKDFDVPKMQVDAVATAVRYCINMGRTGIEIADFTLCQIKDYGETPREKQ